MKFPFTCQQCQIMIHIDSSQTRTPSFVCPECKSIITIPDSLPIGPGVIIDNVYQLQKKINQTRLDDVYLANDLNSEQIVRVHLMVSPGQAEKQVLLRFMKEAELLKDLRHENLLSVLASGNDDNTNYFVTEYEPCTGLNIHLLKVKTLPERIALTYGISVARALRYIWDNSRYVHRNLKPQNVLITNDNVIKITGFSIAKSYEPDYIGLTTAGYTLGTPEYMSPEQIRARDKLDLRTDIYSLGIVLYEMLVGKTPFMDKTTILIMRNHCEEPHAPIKEIMKYVSSDCSAMIDKMLMKDRNDRYQDWDEFINVANEILKR